MNERAIQIITLLLENRDIRVSDIEKELKLTKRQINYSLQLINEFLFSNDVKPIRRDSTGKFYIPDDLYRIFASEITDSSDYYLDSERIEFIIMYLLISDEEISVFHLMDLLLVSRNTILADMKNVKKFLESYQLQLSYSRKDGYLIAGHEDSIRLMMNEIIRNNQRYKRNTDIFKYYISQYHDFSVHLISQVEKQLNIQYADESFSFLLEALKYNFTRLNTLKVRVVDLDDFLIGTSKEYHILYSLLSEELEEKEILWITLLFITSNIYTNNISDYQTFKDSYLLQLSDLVFEMIKSFETQTLIEINNRDKFEQRLLLHLRPAIFRIKYGIKINDHSLQALSSESDIFKHVISKIIIPLENFIGMQIPADEIKLLSLYFEMQLKQEAFPEPKKRAVVVCSNGVMSSRLLLQSLRNLFPELIVLSSMSVREFEGVESDYDVVFSTVPLNTLIKQYMIKPTMNSQERLKLRYRVLNDLDMTAVNELVDDVLNAIKENGQIDNLPDLRERLEMILVAQPNSEDIKFKNLPDLTFYLSNNEIHIIDGPLTWQEAIQLSFKPMLDLKIVNQTYVDDCINQFNDVENYSYFGENMAVPHSDKTNSATEDKIAILISKQGITFPKQKNIHIVAPLVIVDTTKHIKAINQLAKISENQSLIHLFRNAVNKDEVYEAIKKELI